METPSFQWIASVAPLVVLFIVLGRVRGPQFAIGVVVPLSFLLPCWTLWLILSLPRDTVVAAGPDVKVAVSTAALILYMFLPKATYPFRLVACDIAMLSLIAVNFASDVVNTGFSLLIPRIGAEWYAPYVAGRVAFQFRRDMGNLWKIPAAVAVAMAVLAIFEAATGINPLEWIFQERPLEGVRRESARWGFKRAYGPCLHPLYFGVLQLLLAGWTLYAATRALKQRANGIWILAPALSFLGTFSTGSRGPILGFLVIIVCFVLVKIPVARWPIFIAMALAAVLAVFQRENLLDLLEKWSGEQEKLRVTELVVNDETQQFSGTRTRLLMLDMYSIALKRAGLVGYGTEAVTGFPIRVPIPPQEIETLQRVRFIDNTYVLVALRFGYLGLAAFLAAGVAACWQLYRMNQVYANESIGWMALSLCGALVATLFVIATVWMPHDFGFALIWTFGVSSGIYHAHISGNLASKPKKRTRSNAKKEHLGVEPRDSSSDR